MKSIQITVKDKIATRTNDVEYVCGNSDFVVDFTFDAEWEEYESKTARFAYNGKHQDVIFDGTQCPMPIIYGVRYVKVGVYAGDLHTTTPAYVSARKSILCDGGIPADPTPDVYAQIIDMLDGLGVKIGDLDNLTTTARDNLVAAINEAAKSGGAAADVRMQVAGGYIQYSSDGGKSWANLIALSELIGPTDETLTKSGQAADAAVVGNRLSALSEEMLTEESDPTVPAWAKEAQKPSYTASEVGADPSGTASAQVAAHNSGTDTHSDIRVLIQGLTDRINALADSDDTTLDQLSEVVEYIKYNRDLISSITTSKVSVADIVNNLTTNVANKPLSAAQGVALKALIDDISVPDKLPNPNALTFTGAVTGSYDGSAPLSVEIPSGGGGGGGNPLYVNGGTTLAEGTIPSGLAQYTFTDTGLKLYEVLQEWKIFFIQTYCAGEANEIECYAYKNNNEPRFCHGKDSNYALSIFEGVTKDSVKFMFFGAGVGRYWDVYSPAGYISSYNMNSMPTLAIKHIPPDAGLYLRNYGKATSHDYLWKVTGLVKWG